MANPKIVPMGDKYYKAMTRSLVMSYPKSERKRQIVADRFNYGPIDEKPSKLPEAKNLVRGRKRIGAYMGLSNIESLVKTAPAVAPAPKEETRTTRVMREYTKYVFRDKVTGKIVSYASAGKLPHAYR